MVLKPVGWRLCQYSCVQVGPVAGKSTWGFWLPRSKKVCVGGELKRQLDKRKSKATKCFENRGRQEWFQNKRF